MLHPSALQIALQGPGQVQWQELSSHLCHVRVSRVLIRDEDAGSIPARGSYILCRSWWIAG